MRRSAAPSDTKGPHQVCTPAGETSTLGTRPGGIVLATRNPGKISEIRHLLEGLAIAVRSLDEFDCPELVECGERLEENAVAKATQAARHTGLFALADDSGLQVEYLNGLPGVRSARFAGEHASDRENNEKLLAMLEGVAWEQRRARFRCVAALARPDGACWTVEGSCEGVITTSAAGTQGFGYDPLFFFPPLGKTFAQLDAAQKNRVSHRGQALQKLKRLLSEAAPGEP